MEQKVICIFFGAKDGNNEVMSLIFSLHKTIQDITTTLFMVAKSLTNFNRAQISNYRYSNNFAWKTIQSKSQTLN